MCGQHNCYYLPLVLVLVVVAGLRCWHGGSPMCKDKPILESHVKPTVVIVGPSSHSLRFSLTRLCPKSLMSSLHSSHHNVSRSSGSISHWNSVYWSSLSCTAISTWYWSHRQTSTQITAYCCKESHQIKSYLSLSLLINVFVSQGPYRPSPIQFVNIWNILHYALYFWIIIYHYDYDYDYHYHQSENINWRQSVCGCVEGWVRRATTDQTSSWRVPHCYRRGSTHEGRTDAGGLLPCGSTHGTAHNNSTIVTDNSYIYT